MMFTMSFRATLALAVAVLAADPPLVGRLSSAGAPSVELKNTGAQAVTAWAFAVSTPNAAGGIHREIHSADVYLGEVTRGLPRSPEHLDWLRPNQSRVIPVDAAPPGASVEILAVIIEDGTAWGDAKTLKSFFDHRALERDELGRVVATFDAVLPAQKGVAALEQLQRRFTASTAGEESVPHRSAREAVDAFLQRARAPKGEDVDDAVRKYVEFVRKQHQLAVKHAQQK